MARAAAIRTDNDQTAHSNVLAASVHAQTPPARPPPWRWPRTGKLGFAFAAIIVFNLLLIATLWRSVTGVLASEREQTISSTITANDNLAIALEQYVRSHIESVDLVLRSVVRESVHGSLPELETLVTQYVRRDRNLAGLVTVDAKGMPQVTALIVNPSMTTTLADQEHFRVHADSDSDLPHVGKPMISRVAKRMLIPVTRRINMADGSFGGIAMALLEPTSFTDLMRDATLRPLNTISVVGLDGITRARLRGTIPSGGEDISASPLFKEQARRPHGNYSARGQVDGVPRYFSYRTLPEYRLLATVGAAEVDVLAEFNTRRTRYFTFSALATTIIILFTAFLVLALRRQQQDSEEIAHRRAQHAATFNQSAIGMAHVDTTRRLIDVNQKLCYMLGYSRNELLARTLADITHAEDLALACGDHLQPTDGDIGDVVRETRLLRKSGSVAWCLQTISPVCDEHDAIEYYAHVIQDISDRKWLEAAARSGARAFHDLVNLLPVAVYVCSLSGAIETYNRSAAELWGREPAIDDDTEKFCGSFRLHHPHGGLMPHDQCPLAQVLKTGIPVSNREIVIERPDGTRRSALVNAAPRLDAEGRLTGAINCIIDITDRIEAERKTRDLTHYAETLIAASPIGIITYRASGQAVTANPAIARMIGCTVSEAVAQNFREIRAWQETGLLAKARKALSTGRPQSMEMNAVSSFGKAFSLDCRLIPFLFLGEQHLMCFFDDLSEEKRILAALRESEGRLSNAQRIAHMGNWDLDIQTNTLHWSDQIYEIFGIEKTRFGANYEAFIARVHPDDRARMEQAQRAALDGDAILDIEHRILLPDGTVKHVHELGELVRDAAGEPLRLTGTVADITHRKMLENALRERAQEMQLLSQRLSTVEETERRNIHRELHDQVGANLSALKLDLDLIETRIPDMAKPTVATTLAHAQRLALETVGRVRDVMAELRPAALDDFGLLDALRVDAEARQQRLHIPVSVQGNELKPRPPIAVETALFRIAQEALNNIAKHARARNVTITLGGDDAGITLTVEDDGVGFDPSASDPKRGRWGLRTMHERALGINAELAIESVPGKGTRIIVKLGRNSS